MDKSATRFLYTPLVFGHITQGSIFSGASSETYDGCDVYGIVVTARCSIAQKKVPSYHYLPIVSLNDWRNNDFKRLLLQETIQQQIGKLKDALKQSDLSVELIGKFSYESIKAKVGSRIAKKQSKNFNDAIYALQKLSNEDCSISELHKLNPKGADNIFQRLISHNYVDFYLIESWDKDVNSYYIILLREIRILQQDVFFKIGQGLMKDHLPKNYDYKNDIASMTEDDLYFVQAQIASPYIEHILQRFYYNFGRIGVDDIHCETFSNLKKTCL